MIKKLLLFGLLVMILNSCSESQENTPKFFYKNGNSSVELKILNESNYLTYDSPIRTNFHLINVNPNTVSILGTGIKIIRIENGIIKTEINIPKNYLKSDTLDIRLSFEKDGEKLKTEFNIPIKNRK